MKMLAFHMRADRHYNAFRNALYHGMVYPWPQIGSPRRKYGRNVFHEGPLRNGLSARAMVVERGLAWRLVSATTASIIAPLPEFRFRLDYDDPAVIEYFMTQRPDADEPTWQAIDERIMLESREDFPEPDGEPSMEIEWVRAVHVRQLPELEVRPARYRRNGVAVSADLEWSVVPRDERVLDHHGILTGGAGWFVADRLVPLLEPFVTEPFVFWFEVEELVEQHEPGRDA